MLELGQVEHTIAECVLLSECDHPFIVRLIRVFEDKRALYLLMEPTLGNCTELVSEGSSSPWRPLWVTLALRTMGTAVASLATPTGCRFPTRLSPRSQVASSLRCFELTTSKHPGELASELAEVFS